MTAQSYNKIALQVTGALAIVFASFFTTLKLMDYFAAPAQKSALDLARHVAALPLASQDGSIDITKMSSQVGKIAGGVAAARAPLDQAGVLLFGPYAHLLPGSYVLYVRFKCAENQMSNAMDVTALKGQQTLAKMELIPHDPRCNSLSHEVELPFDLRSAADNVEFRVIFGGTGTIEITRLRLVVD